MKKSFPSGYVLRGKGAISEFLTYLTGFIFLSIDFIEFTVRVCRRTVMFVTASWEILKHHKERLSSMEPENVCLWNDLTSST